MPVIQPAEADQEEEQGKPLDLTGGLGCALLGWNELTGGGLEGLWPRLCSRLLCVGDDTLHVY